MELDTKFIVIELNNERYGIDLQQVKSIEKMQKITQLPQASFVKGVINLRGIVTPIIDLKERLKLGHSTYSDDLQLLIVQINELQVGLIVDKAHDVIDLDKTKIEQISDIYEEIDHSLLKGIAKIDNMLLILLNVNAVLNQEEINEVDQLVATE